MDIQSFLIVITLLNFISCKDDANINSEPSQEKVIYDEVSVPPTINEIDESNYNVLYVDNSSGNDNNTGVSENTPIKTLNKAAIIARNSNTKILLKSGEIFKGPFLLSSLSSTQGSPLIIDSYGGDIRPTIDGEGLDAAVDIQDDNIRFRNIRIINKNGKRGISITTKVAGAFRNIQITGCRIEDVNWLGTDVLLETPKDLNINNVCPNARFVYNNAGISLEANTSAGVGPSWFENIFITNNEIHKVSRTGIWLNTQWGKRPGLDWGSNNYISDDEGWYPAKNVVVQGNNISYTGGDAVVLIATKNSFIDHNKVYHANYLGRTGYYNAGIWPHSSVNFTMQYNEVAYTHLENGGGDGEGMDVDIACVNTLVQFNYVHHNDGGGLLICNNKSSDGQIGNHRGTIVRNNVFYDNGNNFEKGAFLTTSSAVKDVSVYNNLVIASDRLSDLKFVLSADWANVGMSENFTFKNNIFVGTKPVRSQFDIAQIINCKFENNLIYQVGSQSIINDRRQLNYDPLVNIPNAFDGYEKGLSFKPQEPKIFIGGLVFSGMSYEDIGGNIVGGVNYLGPFSK